MSPTVQENHNQCRYNTSEAGALAVMFKLRLLNFAESKKGMAAYAKAVFYAEKDVPLGIPINPESYLPTRTVINTAMKSIAFEQQAHFADKMEDELSGLCGAVSITELILKLQVRQAQKFTIHHDLVVK